MRSFAPARRPHLALAWLAALGGAFAWTLIDAARLRAQRASAAAAGAGWAARLGLTDICIFTEARYTRRLSLTGLHSAFQDHPGALEHFPSGSLTSPPRPEKRHADLD